MHRVLAPQRPRLVPQPWYGMEPPRGSHTGQLMITPGSRGGFSYMPVYGGRIVRVRWYAPGQPAHGRVLWQHPTYSHGKIEVRPYTNWGRPLVVGQSSVGQPKWEVAVDGEGHAGFGTALAARRWVAKMGLKQG
jgi:hypothetical protein